jgi:predicted small integral membrane protein
MSKVKVVRNGFLPMKTNLFDRIFIGVVFLIALSLIWMRFLEPKGFSLWISTGISLIVGIIVARKG